jgi:hypothetical protein
VQEKNCFKAGPGNRTSQRVVVTSWLQNGHQLMLRTAEYPGLLPKARRNRISCLRVQISAKDAHNVQRDGLAFGGKRERERNFDPGGACARSFAFFFPPFRVIWSGD